MILSQKLSKKELISFLSLMANNARLSGKFNGWNDSTPQEAIEAFKDMKTKRGITYLVEAQYTLVLIHEHGGD